MMDPAPYAVEAAEHGTDDAPFNLGHEKQLWLDSEFAFDHSLRFIPGRIVGEDLAPQRDDGRPICAGVRTNHNVAHLAV